MISLTNIHKSFGPKDVIKGIDLQISEAETHSLLGESGCGKSTILRLIIGILKLNKGQILVDGRSVSEISRSEKGEIFGFVLQNAALFPHLNVKKNLLLPFRTHQPKIKATPDERILELLELVKLSPKLLESFPFQLSGGQRQRVALVRALLLDPPYLLMDEPLSALDPIIRSELQDELKSIFSKLKKTVILVTHDLDEADYLGDRISLIQSGEIIQQGKFEEFQKNPQTEYVRQFVYAQTRKTN